MVSLLKSITLEGFGYLGIALTVSLTSHSQIHAYLAALAIEVGAQVVNHFLAHSFGLAVTNAMYCGIGGVGIVLQFTELAGRSLADGAAFGSLVAFMDVTTNGTNEFLCHNIID